MANNTAPPTCTTCGHSVTSHDVGNGISTCRFDNCTNLAWDPTAPQE